MIKPLDWCVYCTATSGWWRGSSWFRSWCQVNRENSLLSQNRTTRLLQTRLHREHANHWYASNERILSSQYVRRAKAVSSWSIFGDTESRLSVSGGAIYKKAFSMILGCSSRQINWISVAQKGQVHLVHGNSGSVQSSEKTADVKLG